MTLKRQTKCSKCECGNYFNSGTYSAICSKCIYEKRTNTSAIVGQVVPNGKDLIPRQDVIDILENRISLINAGCSYTKDFTMSLVLENIQRHISRILFDVQSIPKVGK